jgi:hypothetical protein
MGLKPDELRRTTLYDFNLMGRAFTENRKHDFNVMRLNAFLVSVYSGLEGKARKKLTPNKMFPMDEIKKEQMSREELIALFERSNKRRGVEC